MLSKRVVGVAILLVAVIVAGVLVYNSKSSNTKQTPTPAKQPASQQTKFKVDYDHSEKPVFTQ